MAGIAILSGLVVAACGPAKQGGTGGTTASGATAATPAASPAASPAAADATAKMAGGKIESKSGSKVTGSAWFKPNEAGKLTLHVKVEGATPGEHAVHLHEKGDCSAADASSAGGHYNPKNVAHGAPTGETHHAGDFGNLVVNKEGKGNLTLATDWLTIEEVTGKALIVHEKADDMKTQPTGAAGGRVGCAVITAKANASMHGAAHGDGHGHDHGAGKADAKAAEGGKKDEAAKKDGKKDGKQDEKKEEKK